MKPKCEACGKELTIWEQIDLSVFHLKKFVLCYRCWDDYESELDYIKYNKMKELDKSRKNKFTKWWSKRGSEK